MPDLNPSERLAEIEARVEAATPGPWLVKRDEESDAAWIAWERPDTEQLHTVLDEGVPPVPGDANFIAHAREDIPWLLEQVREARRALADLIQRQDRSIGQPSIRIEDWHRKALADSGEAGGEAG